MPDIKERPIIFSGEMVRKILAGEKTQTRRVVKPQPYFWQHPNFPDKPEMGRIMHPDGYEIGKEDGPYGKPGERLYVRETCLLLEAEHIIDGKKIVYRADATPTSEALRQQFIDAGYPFKWRPSIHMPRWASRITLEITDVRIERLQSITEEDAVAEGFEVTGWSPTYNDPDNADCLPTFTPRDNFAEYWSVLNAKRGFSWDSNPWVFVIEFRRVKP